MANRSRPLARRTRVLAAGLLAVVAAELAVAAMMALTSDISWAAAVGSFTVTNGAMGLGFAVCGVLLAWYREGNPVGWLFLAAAAEGVLFTLSVAGPPVQPGPLRHRPGGRRVQRPPARCVDLDSVSADLAAVVQAALEPAHLSVWISRPPDSSA